MLGDFLKRHPLMKPTTDNLRLVGRQGMHRQSQLLLLFVVLQSLIRSREIIDQFFPRICSPVFKIRPLPNLAHPLGRPPTALSRATSVSPIKRGHLVPGDNEQPSPSSPFRNGPAMKPQFFPHSVQTIIHIRRVLQTLSQSNPQPCGVRLTTFQEMLLIPLLAITHLRRSASLTMLAERHPRVAVERRLGAVRGFRHESKMR